MESEGQKQTAWQTDPEAAVKKYREELLVKNGKDFIPYTFQLPISLVVAKVSADYRLLDLVALDEEQSRPHEIVKMFWEAVAGEARSSARPD